MSSTESVAPRLLRLVYLALISAALAPFAFAAFDTIQSNDLSLMTLILPTGRRLGLLATSLVFAATSAAAATCIGLLAALTLSTGPLGRRPILRWLPLTLATVPPYVHALVWSQALSSLGPSPGGLGIAIWVQVMALLPIASALGLVGLMNLPARALDSARLHRPPATVLLRVVLPLLAPSLVSSVCLLFVLSLITYGLPSLFSVSTYALEVFAEFSTSQDPSRALLTAVPLLAATCGAVALLQPTLRRLTRIEASDRASLDWDWPAWFNILRGLALVAVIVQLLVPLGALVAGVGSPSTFVRSISEAWPELTFSLVVAIISAALALPLAAVVAERLREPARRGLFWWMLTLLPLAVPAPLIGIGILRLTGPAPLWLTAGPVLPVTAALIRFTPFAVLVILACLRSSDRDQDDAALVFQPSAVVGFRLRARLRLPALAAAAGIVFALTLGEIGATLMVTPPGHSTLAIRIYNYIHYGASESVAGLCLFMTVLTSLAFLTALLALSSRRSPEGACR